MGDHSPSRVAIILLSVVVYVAVLAFNGLAGRGKGPFLHGRGYVSVRMAAGSVSITPKTSGASLVQNGIAVYTTWTTIATLINLTIVLDVSGVSKTDAATVSLCLLLIEVLGWFIVENFVIDRHVRYILTIYPVVMMALVGNVYKHYDPEAPGRNAELTGIKATCFHQHRI
ncbi:hypothetical protein AALO_G00019340 [Alosa alosa]|uniref:Uncharacterized protein n=1 Tax=Alosa alosa TaxID=278164 RepID=A0AAV6HKD5_9TELE|nr:hypothetical protein AALO_G00019340 [Alosa alosa]